MKTGEAGMISVTVSIENITFQPFANAICYPKSSEQELLRRHNELRGLGVNAIQFSGTSSAHGVAAPILGKGFVGIVVVAQLDDGIKAALKIRRVDADRADLLHEAKMLGKVNNVNIGPKIINASKNFLLMQLITGKLLPKWLAEKRDENLVKNVLEKVLEQCWKLDQLGIDHGELSNASKHVIVDDGNEPFLLDFETASTDRKPANVTAMCSFLFLGTCEVAKLVQEILGERSRDDVIKALQSYKERKNQESFSKVLIACLS